MDYDRPRSPQVAPPSQDQERAPGLQAQDTWGNQDLQQLDRQEGSSSTTPTCPPPDGTIDDRARAIHHQLWVPQPAPEPLLPLRGLAPPGLTRLRLRYAGLYCADVEDDFAALRPSELREALVLMWPAMSVADRVRVSQVWLEAGEQGLLDVLRVASLSELELAASRDGERLRVYLEELEGDELLEARKLLWPTELEQHVIARVEEADGLIFDDASAVARALVELEPQARTALWEHRADLFGFLAEDQLAELEELLVAEGETQQRDPYAEAVQRLEEVRGAPAVLEVLLGLSSQDREALSLHMPAALAFHLTTGLDLEEVELAWEVLRTGKVPSSRALDLALTGGSEDLAFIALTAVPESERRQHRLGYWLSSQDQAPESTEEREALETYQALRARLDDHLGERDLQEALDRLIGLPSPEELVDPEGKERAVDVMLARQVDKRDLEGGVADAFTSSDERVELAGLQLDAMAHQVRSDGALDDTDLTALVALDAQANDARRAHAESTERIRELGAMVGSIAVGVVIIVASGGTMAPAVLAAAAGASAATRVVLSEVLGGDLYDATGSDGARDAVVGGLEGACAVAAAGLAARTVTSVGLSRTALSRSLTRAALDSADTGLSTLGRGGLTGGLEGVIDGALSGAVGELTLTATDAETYKRGTWDALAMMGRAALKGGLVGGLTGGVVGGSLGVAGTARGQSRLGKLYGDDLVGDLQRTVGPEELEGLSRELGASVEVDPSLGSRDVRVLFPDGAVPTRIRIGAEASVAEVRLHRETVALARRYEGVLGRLRTLWEELGAWMKGADPSALRGARELQAELDKVLLLQQARRGVLQELSLEEGLRETLEADLSDLVGAERRLRAGLEEVRSGRGWVGQQSEWFGEVERGFDPEEQVREVSAVEADGLRVIRPRGSGQSRSRVLAGTPVETVLEQLESEGKSLRQYLDMVCRYVDGRGRAEALEVLREEIGDVAARDWSVEGLRRKVKRGLDPLVIGWLKGLPEDEGHRMLMAMTEGINGADKGRLGEELYAATRLKAPKRQVRAGKEELRGQEISQGREGRRHDFNEVVRTEVLDEGGRADLVKLGYPEELVSSLGDELHYGHAHEVKSGKTLPGEEMTQIEDLVALVTHGPPAIVDGVVLEKAVVTFRDARAPRGQVGRLKKLVDSAEEKLSIEVYDRSGAFHQLGPNSGDLDRLREMI